MSISFVYPVSGYEKEQQNTHSAYDGEQLYNQPHHSYFRLKNIGQMLYDHKTRRNAFNDVRIFLPQPALIDLQVTVAVYAHILRHASHLFQDPLFFRPFKQRYPAAALKARDELTAL